MRVSTLLMVWSSVTAQTITFRSLESTSSSSSALPSNSSFTFDGTNSDIAQQLFNRHRAGDTMELVELSSIPTAVSDRLDLFNINFNDLPGTVQRAVLWDTGFAISPGFDPIQIWIIDGYSMTDLAPPRDEVADAGCTFVDCVQPNSVTASYVQGGTGDQMLSVARCVVDTFEDSDAVGFLGAMWSNGGDSTMTPHIRLRDHSWTDPVTKIPYSVYAVHTVSSNDEVTWNQCPSDGGYASLTVPCYRRDNVTDEISATMVKPTGSPWVTTWLKEEFATDSSSSFDLILLIPIIIGAVVLIVVGWFCWRRRVKMKEHNADGAIVPGSPNFVGISTPNDTTQPSSHGASSNVERLGSNGTLRILLGSEHLKGKRIPYDSLKFEHALATGASGEIWVCEYMERKVAVKRLLQSKEQKAESVQAFAEEIELNASLVHPNIIEFVGVAWNSLNNLVMVLEYFSVGNLKNFLHQNTDKLSWARDKIHMAIGIANALKYLHTRSPRLIHRDLKSNNVLLTDNLEPKLIDFGISRGIIDLTMTAGVGTPYWTAPEILEGKRYTEKADIYSFGVMLTELDTGKIPYHDVMGSGGGKVKPFHILSQIMADTLRPSFSRDCPPRIRKIGLACMTHSPSARPDAKQVLHVLEGQEYSL